MMEEVERLRALVRILRDRLWMHEGQRQARERVWETDAEEERRERHNREGKAEWDAQTERLLDTTSEEA